jgi:hypothetical protein
MDDDAALVDALIAQQLSAIRFHSAYAIGVFCLGAAVLAVGVFLPPQLESANIGKQLLSTGGVFVSTLSAFPASRLLKNPTFDVGPG